MLRRLLCLIVLHLYNLNSGEPLRSNVTPLFAQGHLSLMDGVTGSLIGWMIDK